jgi:hypothetical protein
MKFGAKLLLPFFILLVLPQVVLAHPGNTAADGCHYCRTNCAKWGEVEGARHCHGGYSSAPVYTKTPMPTKKLTITFTPKPTSTSTITPTFTLTDTPMITPLVEGDSDTRITNVLTITPVPTTHTAGDTVLGLGISGVLATIPAWFIYKFIKRKRMGSQIVQDDDANI